MDNNPFELTGKVAAVSGSGRGIGKAMALALARAGADVAVFSRTEEQFSQTAREIESLGRHALGLRVDVTAREDVERMVRAVLEEYGRLDVLVNNAGVNPSYTQAERVEEEHWDTIMDINLKGAFLCCKQVIPVMKKQASGCIINVASVAGLKALYKCSAYNASKGGMVLLSKTMALELAPFGIRVNAIAPGFATTDMTENLLAHPSEGERILSLIPMGRVGELHEIAPAAVFLASDAASYVTGAVICVDGGWSAW
ncbi:MAG: 3-oxoacyl-ACP reductase family protein [Actinomycetota bacterium]|nr:3-oxoacyl-ACP reductase family protein [Actinomycetota bacterium]